MALKCNIQKEGYEEISFLLQEKAYKSWRAKKVL